MTEGLRWLPNAADGVWIDWDQKRRTEPPWVTVANELPSGFAAYARVLPPLRLFREGETRWAELADTVGVEMHPGIRGDELVALAAGWPLGTWHGQDVGLRPKVWHLLREVLLRHTQADSMILGFWEGHLSWPHPPREALLEAPRLSRRYALAKGSTTGGGEGSHWVDGHPPCLVWPLDRSWFVHTDIDHLDIYLAGSEEAIEDVLACSDLEAIRVTYDTGL